MSMNASATAQSTLNEAAESDAPIYVVQYDTMTDFVRYGPQPGKKYPALLLADLPRVRSDYKLGDLYLHLLAQASGGRLFQVRSGAAMQLYQDDHPPDLTQPFTQLTAELRQQYSLGYYPKRPAQPDERREIKVRGDMPDVVVRARTSYSTLPPKP